MTKASELQQRIVAGVVGDQEKIEFASLCGRQHDLSGADLLHSLLFDESPDVRYYALRALVLNGIDRGDLSEQDCWNVLENDRDPRVRGMAAACLGSLHSGSRDKAVFTGLKRVLMSLKDPQPAESILEALYNIAGKPPREWPAVRRILERKGNGGEASMEAIVADASNLEIQTWGDAAVQGFE